MDDRSLLECAACQGCLEKLATGWCSVLIADDSGDSVYFKVDCESEDNKLKQRGEEQESEHSFVAEGLANFLDHDGPQHACNRR